ncbi:hypothetical protein [Fusibacter sp. JL216-2]|uniref:hypothetical protein n=1 Tax=Fusibacter sp. JL216-2 TaxID=3071453 RepID=UPI003D326942
MSDSFKTAMRGYDKLDVENYITNVMKSYEESINALNEELSKSKEENEKVQSLLNDYMGQAGESELTEPDKNLKMRSKVIEGKLRERDALIEKAREERVTLEAIIEKEISKKMSDADKALIQMEKKRSDLVETLNAYKAKKTDIQEDKKNRTSIINNINMIEEQIEQLRDSVGSTDTDLLNILERESEENQKKIQGLKEEIDAYSNENINGSLEKDKSKIADIILEAQTEASQMIQNALFEKNEKLKEMQGLLNEEVNELEIIQDRLIYIKDSVQFTLSKNIEQSDSKTMDTSNRLIQFEAL